MSSGASCDRAAIDRLSGKHAKANIVVAQHFFYPTSSLGRFLASGVNHQQDSAFIASLRTGLNCAADRAFQLISRQTPIGFGA